VVCVTCSAGHDAVKDGLFRLSCGLEHDPEIDAWFDAWPDELGFLANQPPENFSEGKGHVGQIAIIFVLELIVSFRVFSENAYIIIANTEADF
jgi:hypothetical protein